MRNDISQNYDEILIGKGHNGQAGITFPATYLFDECTKGEEINVEPLPGRDEDWKHFSCQDLILELQNGRRLKLHVVSNGLRGIYRYSILS